MAYNPFVASIRPEDLRAGKLATQDKSKSESTNDVDIFQDASDLPEKPDPFGPPGPLDNTEHPDNHKLSDQSQKTVTNNLPEQIVDEDGDEDEYEDKDIEELMESINRCDRWLEQIKQRNPDVLPDQLEIHFSYLQGVLQKLPNNIADDPDKFREELVRRGLAGALIIQRMEDMAPFAKQDSPECPEEADSVCAQRAADDGTWSVPLPLRSLQQEQGQQPAQSRVSGTCQQPEPPPGMVEAMKILPDQMTEQDWRTEAEEQRAAFRLCDRVPIALSGLSIIDDNRITPYSLTQRDLVRVELDLATNVLLIETRKPSPSVHKGLETSEEIKSPNLRKIGD